MCDNLFDWRQGHVLPAFQGRDRLIDVEGEGRVITTWTDDMEYEIMLTGRGELVTAAAGLTKDISEIGEEYVDQQTVLEVQDR